MPLSIAAITLLGAWAGLPWIPALLLGASLAPTDPVLAADVQVGPPKSGEEDEVRFGLTSEAGLNDGLAFPFVNLAIALSLAAASGEPWLLNWLTYSVIWEIGGGVAGGWLVGRVFGWPTFRMPGDSQLAMTGDGLIAIAATFVSYGLTEMIHCYGLFGRVRHGPHTSPSPSATRVSPRASRSDRTGGAGRDDGPANLFRRRTCQWPPRDRELGRYRGRRRTP